MINKPFRLCLSVLVCFFSLHSMAQNATRSPYSFSGIGDLNYAGFAQQAAMGRTGRAIHADNDYSILNPASYAHVKLTTVQFGARFDLGNFNINGETARFSNGTFSYFSMAAPLAQKKDLGFVFGLSPVSSVGYNMVGTDDFDTTEIDNNYTGKGGVNKAYFGLGYNINKNFSVGFNVNYLFGKIQENQARIYLSNKDIFSYVSEKSTHIGGFTGDLGVQYIGRTKKGVEHAVGATFHLGNSVNADVTKLLRTFNSRGGFYIDTIDFAKDLKGKVTLPTGFGLAHSISKPNRWAINAEYVSYDWTKFESFGVNPGFNKSATYSIGGFYQASEKFEKAVKGEKFRKYLRFVRYTAGAYYQQSHLVLKNTQITEVGTSFGLQLPIVRQIKLPAGEQISLVSRINISAELARRGTTDNGLLQENYLRVYLGFNFSDKWFIKRKYL